MLICVKRSDDSQDFASFMLILVLKDNVKNSFFWEGICKLHKKRLGEWKEFEKIQKSSSCAFGYGLLRHPDCQLAYNFNWLIQKREKKIHLAMNGMQFFNNDS